MNLVSMLSSSSSSAAARGTSDPSTAAPAGDCPVTRSNPGGNNSYVHKMPGRTKWTNLTLKWGTTSATRSTALSTGASTVYSGLATAGATQDVFFRVDIGWTSDTPVTLAASCRLPVTFSATLP